MNQEIKDLQSFFKTSPLGIAYGGPIDGVLNPQLVSAANSLQNIIKQKLPNSSIIILNNDNVVTHPSKLAEILKQIQTETTNQQTPQIQANQNVKAIQELFSSSPLGISYKGPKDGVVNQEFISAAQQLENKIQTITGAKVIGKIISGTNVTTTADDLNKTLKLINDYQKSKK